jgi:hypothetical protein
MGCNGASDRADQASSSTSNVGASAMKSAPLSAAAATLRDESHTHAAGAHGGTIVSLGADNYHAEIIFEKNGILRLYTLGREEDRIEEVDIQELTGYVKTTTSNESTKFVMNSQPQAGDTTGKTSQFVANLPEQFWGASFLAITIPSIRIRDERFRLSFTSQPASHTQDVMPEKVADTEEINLYLTPGGMYTESDIEANGRLTASQRFQGFMSAHDMNPKPGDKICPVTQTKANSKCSWIVGGKKYEFCCPPCVDEFVRMAKEGSVIQRVTVVK